MLTGTAKWTGNLVPPERHVTPLCKPALAASFLAAVPPSVTRLLLGEFFLQPAVARGQAALPELPSLECLRLEVNHDSAEKALAMLWAAAPDLTALTALEVRAGQPIFPFPSPSSAS